MFPRRFYMFTLSFHLRILEISSCDVFICLIYLSILYIYLIHFFIHLLSFLFSAVRHPFTHFTDTQIETTETINIFSSQPRVGNDIRANYKIAHSVYLLSNDPEMSQLIFIFLIFWILFFICLVLLIYLSSIFIIYIYLFIYLFIFIHSFIIFCRPPSAVRLPSSVIRRPHPPSIFSAFTATPYSAVIKLVKRHHEPPVLLYFSGFPGWLAWFSLQSFCLNNKIHFSLANASNRASWKRKMVEKSRVLLIHKQQTNLWMKLPTIPSGLAGKIVKYRPLLKPIRMQDLEETPGNSWWGCAARFSKSWPDVRPENVILLTRFQTRPLKSIPVFRPGLWQKLSYLYLD